jgi:hypothetical protein
LRCDERSVRLIDRSRKEGVRKNIEVLIRINAGLSHQGECLCKGFDNRADQEIAAELYDVGGGRVLAENERLLPYGLEEPQAFPELVLGARSHDKQLACSGRFGASKNGSGNVVLSLLSVLRGEPA